MKRLLCIVGKMDAGGAETFLMKVYRNLDKSMYQMDFAVAVPEKGFYDDEILKLGGKIHHITPKSAGFLKNFSAIKNVARENHYEYVMRISQHSLSALELLAAGMGGAKVRAFRSSNSNTTSTSKVNQLMHKLCMFMPMCFANVRIAPSTEAAEFMFGKGCVRKGKVVLLHNAIDLSVYHYDQKAREEIRKEFGITSQTVVGHVGRFNHQKNHSFMLDVFSEFQKKQPDSVLLLVGKGELEEATREKVKALGLENKVIFAGVRADVPRILSAMDIFLFPSLFEGMPNTVIEAQAAGLPCIISNTITKEANITGNVRYLPLNNPADVWACEMVNSLSRERMSNMKMLEDAGYSIDEMVKDFSKLIFGK